MQFATILAICNIVGLQVREIKIQHSIDENRRQYDTFDIEMEMNLSQAKPIVYTEQSVYPIFFGTMEYAQYTFEELEKKYNLIEQKNKKMIIPVQHITNNFMTNVQKGIYIEVWSFSAISGQEDFYKILKQ
jgi:hypothetical protein